MLIQPGMRIFAGRKSKREGTISAIVKKQGTSGPFYLMSNHHVLVGRNYAPSANVTLADGTTIAEYDSTDFPKKKYKYVDLAFAKIGDDIDVSNRVLGTDIELQGFSTPVVDDTVEIYAGKSGARSAQVIDVGNYLTHERFSVLVKADNPLAKGDSGSVWYSPSDGRIVGVHTRVKNSASLIYDTVWLDRANRLLNIELVGRAKW